MAGMTDLAIRIATTLDSTGLTKADKAVKGLDKSVKQLGRTLGISLGSAALVAYGRAAVKAFAADEAAAIRLTNAVENLGLAYANPEITRFIDNLERTTAIADDTLRPALQALLTTTKDLGASYTLLNNAIAISRGSGIALGTVAQDLANGYVGVTRGLRKYNTGLSQTELKQKSFTEVLARLNKQFAGANQAYLDSYSFKLDALTIASERAKETIGQGLVQAFAQAGGGSEIQDAVKAIDNIAKAINGITQAVGFAVGGLTKLYKALDFITSFGGLFGADGKVVQKLAPEKLTSSATKAAQTQIKATTVLAKAQTKNTAELKKQNALKKAGTIFDLEQIQIIAALKGRISAEDRKRLELQLALATENLDEVQRLTRELALSQGLGTELAAFLADLPSAKNPFEAWKGFLDGIESQAARIANMQFNLNAGMMGNFQYTIPTGNFTYGQGNPLNTSVFIQPQQSAPSTVVVNVAGSVTTSQSLIDEIRGGLNVAALSGSSANVERRIGGW